MFHSDKNMWKLKLSNKPFKGKKKATWDKCTTKKRNWKRKKKKKNPPQRTEILNSYNLS